MVPDIIRRSLVLLFHCGRVLGLMRLNPPSFFDFPVRSQRKHQDSNAVIRLLPLPCDEVHRDLIDANTLELKRL